MHVAIHKKTPQGVGRGGGSHIYMDMISTLRVSHNAPFEQWARGALHRLLASGRVLVDYNTALSLCIEAICFVSAVVCGIYIL